MDPYQLAQQQSAATDTRAAQFARMSPMEQAQYGIYGGASRVAGGFAGLMGAEDPQMKIAALRQQLAQGKDLTSSAGWAEYAKELQARGDMSGAAQAAQKSTEIQSGAELKQAKLEQAKELRAQQDAAAMERLKERLAAEERMNMNTNETRSMMAQLAASIKATKGEVADDKAATRIGQNTVFDSLITEGTGLVSEIDKNKDAFSLSGRGTAAFQSVFNPEAPEVRVKSNVDSYLNKARNAYLLAAKGTQTEGDAQRAWSEFAGSLDFSSAAGAKRSVERITKELGTQKKANEAYLSSRGLRSEGQPAKIKKWSDL